MSTHPKMEFVTTSEESAARVNQAPGSAFETVASAATDGVDLMYWREQGGRFPVLIESIDGGSNPLMDMEAARDLPRVTGECVEGGYPRLVVDRVGSGGLVL